MNARPQVLQFGHLADPRGTLHHGCNGCGPRAACAGSSTLAGSPAAADQVLQKIAGWGANSIRIPLDPEPSSSAARCVLEVLGEAETVYLSVFVLAELLAGLKGGQRERRNREGLKAFMAAPSVKLLFATDTTAEIFAGVKDSLRRRGKPLPMNDVWIATHALEAAATLLTFDAHFELVEGLQRWPGR